MLKPLEVYLGTHVLVLLLIFKSSVCQKIRLSLRFKCKAVNPVLYALIFKVSELRLVRLVIIDAALIITMMTSEQRGQWPGVTRCRGRRNALLDSMEVYKMEPCVRELTQHTSQQ